MCHPKDAHSLALSVVFESAMQHFADKSDTPSQGYPLVFKHYPFVKEFTLTLPTSLEKLNVTISDVTGRIIKKVSASNTSTFSFSLENEANGVYFIQLNTGKETKVYKVLKHTEK